MILPDSKKRNSSARKSSRNSNRNLRMSLDQRPTSATLSAATVPVRITRKVKKRKMNPNFKGNLNPRGRSTRSRILLLNRRRVERSPLGEAKLPI